MTVGQLLAAHISGDRSNLRQLAVGLAEVLRPPAALPDDPVALEAAAEDTSYEQAGTWQEVRAARDYGRLTPAEYDYLSAAVAARSQEDA